MDERTPTNRNAAAPGNLHVWGKSLSFDRCIRRVLIFPGPDLPASFMRWENIWEWSFEDWWHSTCGWQFFVYNLRRIAVYPKKNIRNGVRNRYEIYCLPEVICSLEFAMEVSTFSCRIGLPTQSDSKLSRLLINSLRNKNAHSNLFFMKKKKLNKKIHIIHTNLEFTNPAASPSHSHFLTSLLPVSSLLVVFLNWFKYASELSASSPWIHQRCPRGLAVLVRRSHW